ncbi:hypothetical protein [Streptomyces sp. Tu102]|uniref:hypothetical protein n=1 Tax=Streptomyces sp. Tu102 TaxID=2838019 RepID=UPI001BDD47F6|nr:hypothetical protein [Streptomyces sp. Tu102]MBT1091631.1 hypothetical protein [Streptomyces sp. Tu102]
MAGTGGHPVRTVIVVLVVVGCGLLFRLLRYPCVPGRARFTFSFGAEERAARRALSDARGERRSAYDKAHRSEADAERRWSERVAPYRKRVQELQAARAVLPKPGQGQAVRPERWLPRLELHQHVLLFMTEEASDAADRASVDERLPLAGIAVEFGHTRDNVHIRVTRPDGTSRTEHYPRDREVAAYDLTEDIRNQVLRHEEFLRRLEAREAELVAEIKRAEADLAQAGDAGRPELDTIREAARTRRARADALLRAARDGWKKDAGGLRPWR